MNILLANISYGFNLGDTAMLKIAIHRIREVYPESIISVFTPSPSKIVELFPNIFTIPSESRRNFLASRVFPIPVRFLLKPLRKRFRNLERELLLFNPKIAYQLIRFYNFLGRHNQQSDVYFQTIKKADIVIAAGGGLITDYFFETATETLSTLRLAQQLGKKTAMFGQGIGPVNNSVITRLARKVFPKLAALGLREGLTSPVYARQFGISEARFSVTGDDAIELAIRRESKAIDPVCLGVNIRRAYYSGETDNQLLSIKEIISEFASTKGSTIIPIPISKIEPNSDLEATAKLFTISMQEYLGAARIDTIDQLLNQIDRCKFIVTGSYHAAVFALSRGIPVICLVGSRYYRQKFHGLSIQFGWGCFPVEYNSTNLNLVLNSAFQKCIEFSENESQNLLNEAHQQTRQSTTAWFRFLTSY